MSRIDISIVRESSDELVANRGFCRSSAVEQFMVGSDNARLQGFGNELLFGIDLDEDSIERVVGELEFSIKTLESGGLPDDSSENSIQGLIEDLKDSLIFLRSVPEKFPFSEFEVEIS